MTHYYYMYIPLCWFPQYIIEQYKIMDLVNKDNFSMSISARICMVYSKQLTHLLTIK